MFSWCMIRIFSQRLLVVREIFQLEYFSKTAISEESLGRVLLSCHLLESHVLLIHVSNFRPAIPCRSRDIPAWIFFENPLYPENRSSVGFPCHLLEFHVLLVHDLNFQPEIPCLSQYVHAGIFFEEPLSGVSLDLVLCRTPSWSLMFSWYMIRIFSQRFLLVREIFLLNVFSNNLYIRSISRARDLRATSSILLLCWYTIRIFRHRCLVVHKDCLSMLILFVSNTTDSIIVLLNCCTWRVENLIKFVVSQVFYSDCFGIDNLFFNTSLLRICEM